MFERLHHHTCSMFLLLCTAVVANVFANVVANVVATLAELDPTPCVSARSHNSECSRGSSAARYIQCWAAELQPLLFAVFQQLIHLSELHWQSGTFCSACRWTVGLFVISSPSLQKSVFFSSIHSDLRSDLIPQRASCLRAIPVSRWSQKWNGCVPVSHTGRGESLQCVDVFMNTWEEWGLLLHVFIRTTFTATQRLCFVCLKRPWITGCHH